MNLNLIIKNKLILPAVSVKILIFGKYKFIIKIVKYTKF